MRRLGALGVAILLAVGATSAQAEVVPVEGSWAGLSSAKLPVHFGVSHGRVVNTRFKFNWGFCGTYESHEPNAELEIDTSGHWAFEDSRGQTLEGTFVAPDRVEGKVISVERMTPGCPRTEATFTATPVPTNPESMAAARLGIEALPFPIQLQRPSGAKNTLVGTVDGKRGESFRFFLFVNRKPARHLRGFPEYRLAEGALEGGPLANTDYMFSTLPKRHETSRQRRERRRILEAVENTVCRRQLGRPC
ncbi:MAG: hypothetical protein ACM3Q9_00750 [Methanosarcina sp.]